MLEENELRHELMYEGSGMYSYVVVAYIAGTDHQVKYGGSCYHEQLKKRMCQRILVILLMLKC
jgi:hypothetical protein